MKCSDIYCVYVIESSNGSYVGITTLGRFDKRKSSHKSSGRFGDEFVMSPIYMSVHKEHIEDMEEFFISEFDSYYNGLNKTCDGKGVDRGYGTHTTLGYKFSEESKLKMSKTRKRLLAEGRVKLPVRTEEQKRKAVAASPYTTPGTIRYQHSDRFYRVLFSLYDSKPQILKDRISENRIIGINGKTFKSYDRAFSNIYCSDFGLSNVGLYNIITDARGKYDKFRT